MQTTSILPQTPKNFYREGMTSAEVDEINEAEARALDWQNEARRTHSRYATRMAREYTEEVFALAAKFGVATCVKAFQEVGAH